jgi:hypothetical protein
MTAAAPRGAGAVDTTGRWWLIPWYPAAFPIAFILFMWSGTGIEPIWFVRPMLIAVAFTLLLTLAMAFVLHDRDRGALAATAFVVALALGNVLASAAVALIGLLVVVEGVVNRGIAWQLGRTATRALAALGAALLLVVVLAGVQQGSFGWAVEDVQARLAREPMAPAYDPAAPDIYVVLLDGYPGDDAAVLDPSFDADAFPDALTDRGFDVQRHSRSNYLLTRLTLATMFGNDHVADESALGPPHGPPAADNRRLRRFSDEGPIMRLLGDYGYERTTTPSAALDLGLYGVDRVIPHSGLQEFEFGLLKITTAGHLIDLFASDFIAAESRANVIGVIEGTKALAAEAHDRPRFVYSHVMAPHPPFLFDGDGTPTGDSVLSDSFVEPANEGRSSIRVSATFSYATFAGREAIGIVDAILKDEREDPVIVVMSDHGTETGFSGRDPFGSDVNERSSNFLAVRTPGHPDLLPAGTTPINVLPRILNAYLGTNLPYHSDTTWAWDSGHSVLDAVEVDTTTFQPKR